MMIDNPHVIREIIKNTGAKPTDDGAKAMIQDENFKANLDKIAEEFAPYAEKEWKEVFNEQGNIEFSRG